MMHVTIWAHAGSWRKQYAVVLKQPVKSPLSNSKDVAKLLDWDDWIDFKVFTKSQKQLSSFRLDEVAVFSKTSCQRTLKSRLATSTVPKVFDSELLKFLRGSDQGATPLWKHKSIASRFKMGPSHPCLYVRISGPLVVFSVRVQMKLWGAHFTFFEGATSLLFLWLAG